MYKIISGSGNQNKLRTRTLNFNFLAFIALVSLSWLFQHFCSVIMEVSWRFQLNCAFFTIKTILLNRPPTIEQPPPQYK